MNGTTRRLLLRVLFFWLLFAGRILCLYIEKTIILILFFLVNDIQSYDNWSTEPDSLGIDICNVLKLTDNKVYGPTAHLYMDTLIAYGYSVDSSYQICLIKAGKMADMFDFSKIRITDNYTERGTGVVDLNINIKEYVCNVPVSFKHAAFFFEANISHIPNGIIDSIRIYPYKSTFTDVRQISDSLLIYTTDTCDCSTQVVFNENTIQDIDFTLVSHNYVTRYILFLKNKDGYLYIGATDYPVFSSLEENSNFATL